MGIFRYSILAKMHRGFCDYRDWIMQIEQILFFLYALHKREKLSLSICAMVKGMGLVYDR